MSVFPFKVVVANPFPDASISILKLSPFEVVPASFVAVAVVKVTVLEPTLCAGPPTGVTVFVKTFEARLPPIATAPEPVAIALVPNAIEFVKVALVLAPNVTDPTPEDNAVLPNATLPVVLAVAPFPSAAEFAPVACAPGPIPTAKEPAWVFRPIATPPTAIPLFAVTVAPPPIAIP